MCRKKLRLEAKYAQIQFAITFLVLCHFPPTYWRSVPFVEYWVLLLKLTLSKVTATWGILVFMTIPSEKENLFYTLPNCSGGEWLDNV